MESIYGFPFSVDGNKLFQGRKILQSSAPTISPWMGNRSAATTSFRSTLDVVIPALILSVLCVLVRYGPCCRRCRVDSEPSIHPRVVGGNNGMNKMDIEALPATVYHTGSPLPLPDMDCPICLPESEDRDCPICLSEFVEGEKLRVLPKCCHSFHVDCIDSWLIFNSSCPSCRQSLLDVRFKKSRGVAEAAAREAAQSAQIHVTESHVVQSFNI